MALSDRKILEAMQVGDIVIEPFDQKNLCTSSVDVTLGDWYYAPSSDANMPIYNLYDERHLKAIYGEPKEAVRAGDQNWFHPDNVVGISPDDKIILLAPGQTILAHTNEYIGGRNHITTMMKARSSLGRSFIQVCKCAGWGDVGYINRWTMEITNGSKDFYIPLVVGRRIAQIVFFETGQINAADYSVSGKYQESNDIEKLKEAWKPSDMLPKLYKDRDIKKN